MSSYTKNSKGVLSGGDFFLHSSAILLIFIKLPFVIKTFILSIFE